MQEARAAERWTEDRTQNTKILFANQLDIENPFIRSTHFSIKTWTKSEKELVRNHLLAVHIQQPRLFRKAIGIDEFFLCRTATIAKNTDTYGSYECPAITSPNVLIFADTFFDQQKDAQYAVILHELVHSADLAGQTAFGSTWTEFAAPVISDLKVAHYIDQYCQLEKFSRVSWPSLYGCENLREALAEYFQACFCNTRFRANNLFMRQIIPQLLTANQRELLFLHHYKRGLSLHFILNFSEAIVELKKSARIGHRVALPYVYLCSCYDKLGADKEALEAARMANQIFNMAHVPESEEFRLFVHELEARAYSRLGQIDKQFNLLNKILSINPKYLPALVERIELSEKRNDLASAVDDLLTCSSASTDCTKLISSGAPRVFIVDSLDKAVSLSTNAPNLVGLRALYLLSTSNYDSVERGSAPAYEGLLANLMSSSNQENKANNAITCSQMCLRNKDKKKALEYLKLASELGARSDYIDLKTKLIESDQTSNSTKAEYIAFKNSILKSMY